ncbi:MAG: ATP-binding cassette domain-containing protein [Chloroflexi bacterium]|nr:ATP-binding cassette domain-containing protein [Chloroflexota bacterium]
MQALLGVTLELRPGRVHALIGENGAGKSTLARIMAGVIPADAGNLELHGADVRFASRHEALAAGVGLVPQALSIVGELSLVENFLLGERGLRADRRAAEAALTAATERSGINLPLHVRGAELSLAERQLGEVLLALAEGARVLLLDEPTSSLGPLEVERLINQVRTVASMGSAVVLVTHRLDEVLHAADDVSVLRAGRLVHHGPAGVLDAGSLASLMVGERPAVTNRVRRSPGSARLRGTNLEAAAESGPALRQINLEVNAGEIVGVAGVAGSGQRLLVETLTGLASPTAGDVALDGVDITGSPDRAARLGLAYLPEDRNDGLVFGLTVADNASLLHVSEPRFHRFGLRLRRALVEFARGLCRQFDVRPPRPEIAAGTLSGGNQQKLMAGRELERQPAAIVAHGPTQGLDIAAAAAIRGELSEAAARGAAVLVVSADLDEVLALADRILVLAGGRLVDEQSGHSPDIERLGRAMAGLVA